MTGIYWTPEEASLKTFSSTSKDTTKGVATIIKIELSVNDPWAISSIVRQLDEIKREQSAAKTPPRKTPPPRSERLALPAPLLQLTYSGDKQ